MNSDMKLISSIIAKKLERFEKIRFAHLFFPFDQRDYPADHLLNLALNIKGCFDDEECFQLLKNVIDEIKYALGNEISPIVIISNHKERDYQYLIHKTGQVVFCRDRNALREFQESFKYAPYCLATDPDFKAHQEQIASLMRHAS
ncbi:hypothetical protein GF406_20180 [candidate division KSB1 bacterium]|nr:hypothetical protein [candidate division KSB1 bacterium]